MSPHPQNWLKTTPSGLYCAPGDFYIDPMRAVPRAIITHGHSDHARPGHAHVLATPETLAIMRTRMGEERAGVSQQALAYGQVLKINDVAVTLVPAGHVLGSAQVVMEYQSSRVVVSGDYKRQPDPTCAPFEPVRCDVFVTEATFGLPVFQHPSPEGEIAKLLRSHALFPERTHVVGSYSLGKSQRLIAMLRQAGYDAPIYLHGAHANLCALYETLGVPLGDLRPATAADKAQLKGAMVLAPPSAVGERWGRRLEDPVVAQASGWMRIRQRAKASGIELPLIISDHADWDDLLATIKQTQAPEIWVTHGSEEALIRACALMQIRARALRLVGYGEEEE
ncbi:MAG: ligase-associated DNA damage response exonuclease [Rhodospirillales bacterium]|nr:ligase-associated DNA damage response exonuclease [Rhodospirillales bacterium]